MDVLCYYLKDRATFVAVAKIDASTSWEIYGPTPKEALRRLRKVANTISRKCSKQLNDKKELQSSEATKDL